jgi:SMI1 / KNR4 family (SUKH-1)
MGDRYTELRSNLPLSYVDFIETHNGWEGYLGDELGYVVIWNRESIQERWDAYEMGRYMNERWFTFGSDGGGEMLCFDLPSGTDSVFLLPFIGMSDETAMPGYDSFAELTAAILKCRRNRG